MKFSSHHLVIRRWVLVAIGILFVVVIGLIALKPFISARIERTLTENAQRHGLKLAWKTSSWDPWRGQYFTGMKISEANGSTPPIAEIDRINVHPSLGLYFNSNGGSLGCTVDSAPLILHDGAGSVRMDEVSLGMNIENKKINIDHLTIGRDGLAIDLSGKVLLPLAAENVTEFHSDLSVFRSIFDTLDVKAGTDPFHIKGFFTMNFRQSPLAWSAELEGNGSNLEWKKVHWTNAKAKGKLSLEGTEITYDLATTHGSTNGNVKRSGKKVDPFVFDGKLSDSQGKSDGYHVELLDGDLTLDSLKGSANLWELSKDVPALATGRLEGIQFSAFPDVEVKELKQRIVKGKKKTTIRHLSLISEQPVELVIAKHTIEASGFTAKGSYDGKNWIVKSSTANLLGGSAALSGSYRDGVLRDSQIGIENFRVADVRLLFGNTAGKSSGRITGGYKGSIDFQNKDWEGNGSVRMTDAPVVQVPLLDQAYELFTALIPGLNRDREGEFEANFTTSADKIEVTHFEARGGKSLSVSAVGEIDLRKKRVNGKARGKLVGVPGILTSPLSHLLEMEVSGPYDDIRVKPLGPAKLASATVNGTVGVAVETVGEAGKVIGTVLTEGLKLPFKWMSSDDDDSEKK